MKIYIPKPSENWILDRMIGEFKLKTSHQIVDSPEKASIIFLLAMISNSGWPSGGTA